MRLSFFVLCVLSIALAAHAVPSPSLERPPSAANGYLQQPRLFQPSYGHHVQIHGWAARLDIEAEAKAFDDQLRIGRRQPSTQRFAPFGMIDESSSATSLVSIGIWSTWRWLSSMVTNFRMHNHSTPDRLPTTTSWNDTAPRYVAYGDSYVNNNSFGVPDPKALKGFTYYNIAFWVSTDGAADNVAEWVHASETQRKAIVKSYNDAGIRLGVALFGETDKPLSNGNDPWTLAKKIAKFVKKYNLQGVDVDFEEYDKFEQRQATKWVIPLTRALRDALPAGQYYISHAPIAPLFNTDQYPLGYTWVEQRVGSLIDYYNVQFYNQGDYKDCGSLVNKAVGSWPNTALLQLHTVYKIPLSKIVVGKPARKDDADDGYMSAAKLGQCLAAQAVPKGWNAGNMWWEYRGNLQTTIQSVRAATGL